MKTIDTEDVPFLSSHFVRFHKFSIPIFPGPVRSIGSNPYGMSVIGWTVPKDIDSNSLSLICVYLLTVFLPSCSLDRA